MGRKPSVAKNVDKPLMPEHPFPEMVEQQTSNGAANLPGAADQLENPHPMSSPLMFPNASVDGAVTHHERTPAHEQVTQEHVKPKRYGRKKKSKSQSLSVRRSERIKSGVVAQSANSNPGIEIIEDVTISDSEKDEPVTHVEQVLTELESEPAENLREKSLEEKVDYALQKIDALEKIIEFLKSKVDESTGFYEEHSMASISYRGLYIDSQKKVEALTEENHQLTRKLEHALGKIEVFEKENRVWGDVLDRMKDTVNALVVSNLAKTTEAAVNASTQAVHNACSASAAKRKRNVKEG